MRSDSDNDRDIPKALIEDIKDWADTTCTSLQIELPQLTMQPATQPRRDIANAFSAHIPIAVNNYQQSCCAIKQAHPSLQSDAILSDSKSILTKTHMTINQTEVVNQFDHDSSFYQASSDLPSERSHELHAAIDRTARHCTTSPNILTSYEYWWIYFWQLLFYIHHYL